MKTIVVSALAFVALAAAPAIAADLPVKAPLAPVERIASGWAGWYVGVEGGGGWGRAEQTDVTPFSSERYKTFGGLIGGTLGYNWQSGPLVFGLETDLSYAWIRGSTSGTSPVFGPCGDFHCASEIQAFGTLRGRIGVAWLNFMPYITGGLAYANVHGEEGFSLPGALGSGDQWMLGWTVGGGIEGRLAPNWSAKVEYLYADLGNKDVFIDNIGGAFFPENLRITAQIVRIGVNYRFGGPVFP